MSVVSFRARLVAGLVVAGVLAGCSGPGIKANPTAPEFEGLGSGGPGDPSTSRMSDPDNPLFSFGRNNNKNNGGGGVGIGVNAFLWRGALDTISFMPLASADPFGGVLITEWYTPPGTAGERFKATVYIMSKELRSDGVRVNIYRQILQGGQWVDAPVSDQTVGDIENKILDQARRLREQTQSSMS